VTSEAVLGIDTTGSRVSVAVVAAGEASRTASREGRAGSVLHALIEEILAASGLAPGDLSLVAAVRGPGSFTGLRVGLAAAAGLSMAAGLPAAGVETTRAIALASGLSGPVAVVLDGGHGRVFVALQHVDEGGVRVVEPPFDATLGEALDFLGRHGAAALLRGEPPGAEALLAAGCRPFDAPLAEAAARIAGAGGGEPLEPLYAREPSIRRATP
jgi:tRNA threonylcarbamoyladenosine biosynthesis protein TsaB